MKSREKAIGLSTLISQVKQELLESESGKGGDTPILFIDSVELELQVTVRHSGNAGVKIDVLTIGGAEAGTDRSQDDVHKIKVTLSPLLSKEQLLNLYRKHPNLFSQIIQSSNKGIMKGSNSSSSDRY